VEPSEVFNEALAIAETNGFAFSDEQAKDYQAYMSGKRSLEGMKGLLLSHRFWMNLCKDLPPMFDVAQKRQPVRTPIIGLNGEDPNGESVRFVAPAWEFFLRAGILHENLFEHIEVILLMIRAYAKKD